MQVVGHVITPVIASDSTSAISSDSLLPIISTITLASALIITPFIMSVIRLASASIIMSVTFKAPLEAEQQKLFSVYTLEQMRYGTYTAALYALSFLPQFPYENTFFDSYRKI